MYKIACWNIRGLNHPSKKSKVKELIRREKISCIALLEVKLQEAKVDSAIVGCCPNSSWRGCSSLVRWVG
ncbi:unnamed protein product [Rhodiola kirilowii]